jgi:hypothetical protein
MSREQETIQLPGGPRLQAGVNKKARAIGLVRSRGLLVRGVVVATYVLDDPDHPRADDDPVATYCDVLAYSIVSGLGTRLIPKALVGQEFRGLHDGRIRKPRAAQFDITDNTMDLDASTNPANLDGDHVLVGFMDDMMNQPVILGAIPHPGLDPGNLEKTEGHRLSLKLIDGDPDFFKHHGSYHGINTDGDHIIDTTFANTGELNDDGSEQDPPTDGKGAHIRELPNAAYRQVTFYDMSDPDNPDPKFQLTMDGPDSNFLWELEFIDDGTKITHTPEQTTVDIKGTNQFIVKEDKIEMGADSAADKAALDSKIQTELTRIQNELIAMKGAYDPHVHLSLYQPPLIPLGSPIAVSAVATASAMPNPANPGSTNSDLVTIDS